MPKSTNKGPNVSAGPVKQTPSLISNEKLKSLYAMLLQCDIAAGKGPRRDWAAVSVGVSIDLQEDDLLISTPANWFADHIKGIPLRDLLGVASTRKRQESTNPSQADGSSHVISGISSVAARIGVATGAALKSPGVVVVFLDPDAVLPRSADEAIAFAASRKLPILYIAQGKLKMKDASLAFSRLTAEFRRVPVITVDKNDVVAIYRVAYECIVRARNGGGPSLIEAVPYIAKGRSGRVKAPKQLTPLAQMQQYLSNKGLFSETWRDEIAREFKRKMRLGRLSRPKSRKRR